MALPDTKNNVTTRRLGSTVNSLWTKIKSTFATKDHGHGNITSAGTLQATDIGIATGDKLVVTDASNSNKIARTSATFDGSTTTKALTQAGTFESFAKASDISTAINNLDATATSTDGTNVQVKVTEENGKVTAVNITTDDTAAKDHTHDIKLSATGTSTVDLASNTTYTLSAGGSSISFKTPADNNNHRPVQVNGTQVLANNNITPLNLSAGTNISITDGGTGKVVISDTYTHPTFDASAAGIKKIGRDSNGHVIFGDNITKSDIGLGNVENTKITVTTSSVSDGTNVFNKYVHPTTTSAAAAAVKVGKDSEGHVILGGALSKSDVGLGNVENTKITVTTSSVSDGTNTFNKYVHPTGNGNEHIPSGGENGQYLAWDSEGKAKWVSNPNSDTKVKQNVKTDNAEYPILTKATSATSTTTAEANFAAAVTINPSAGTVKATKFVGDLSGTANVANKLGTSTIGSATKPIYLIEGVPTEASTYAGGTKVTFNGTDKGANAITAYAPTAAGTNNYVLKSNGSGEPTWVEKAPKATVADSAGKLTTARTTYVTLGTASTTTTRDWSGDTTIPVAGTLGIANGGTGSTDAAGARTNLDVYSKSETETLLAGTVVVVASYSDLPASGDSGVIYYVKAASTGEDQYDEYIWATPPGGSAKEYIKVDTHSVDLSNYKTIQTAVDTSAATDDGIGLKFISSFKQGTNGNITDIKTKTVTVASTYSSTGTDPVNGKAVLAAIQTLDAEKTSTDGTNVQVKVTEVDGKITAVNITTDKTADKNHAHGNITSAGAITADGVTIASGDTLVISDVSDNSLVKKTSITFDGSTTTKALTQKGTWETFNNYSHPTATTAAPAAVKVGNDNKGHVVLGDALTKSDVGLSAIDNYKYAGGTSLTLNGTSKSATSAEIYAPTTTGTAGYVLKSNGANSAPTWTAQSTLSAGYATSAGKIGTATLGGVNQPVYWNAGVPATANTYAGGTSLTVNGTSKSAATASIYAPTTTGTAGYVLKSNGNAQAPTWVSAAPSATYAASAAAAETANTANAAATATQLGTADVGSTTAPIYLSGGVPKQGSTYAGGTRVNFNGASKAGATITAYAPTAAGTAGQVLKSTAGTPEWVDASATHTHAISLASGGTSTITLTANQAFTLNAGGNSVTFKMPADSDTKNTAGASNKTATKLFLVGASAQNTNIETSSNSNVYVGTDNCLYSNGTKVKTVQTAVSDPTADGNALSFIDTISQNTNGVISATKKTVSTMVGAGSSTNGTAGLVPAPTSGNQGKYLRGDGTWATPTNTDTKVAQAVKTDNAEYPILAKETTATAAVTGTSNFVAGVTINPSTSAIKATKFIGALQGNADTATKLGTADVGSTTAPIYLSAGIPKQGSTYAGGTKVNFNGTNKGGSTITAYAPTAAGTAGQVLKSTAGTPEWVDASATHTHAISLTSGGTSTITLTANQAFTLNAGGNSVVFKMPADNDSHRPIKVNGTDWLGNNTTAFDICSGSNISLTTTTAGKLTIANTYSYTHPSGNAASKTGKPTANATPGWGDTFTVSQVTTDATSHVSSLTDRTITIPSAKFTGATTAASGAVGLVPAPALGVTGSYLRSDGAWATPTNTKNTAGAGAENGTKLYLVGASAQTDGIKTSSYSGVYIGTDNCLYSNGTKVSVNGHTHALTAASGGTSQLNLAANTVYTLSAGGSTFTFKTPANDGDTKVKQIVTTAAAEYPILAKETTDVTTVTGASNFVAGVTINPSTSAIKATKFIGTLQGNADTASKLGTANKGSATKPIYLSSGTATECSAYAGGTAVTLNGTSKAGATASIYAPTASGTSGYILQSNGNNAAPTWVETVPKATSAGKVGSSLTIKVDTGTTEGSNLYTYNGSAGKTLDIKHGSNITFTTAAGSLTIAGTPDTKNTAGSTNSTSKLYLVGASAQAANPVTNSFSAVYTTNGQLDATKFRVAETCTLQYNSTDQALDFVFA